jgi:hypothetical protein
MDITVFLDYYVGKTTHASPLAAAGLRHVEQVINPKKKWPLDTRRAKSFGI